MLQRRLALGISFLFAAILSFCGAPPKPQSLTTFAYPALPVGWDSGGSGAVVGHAVGADGRDVTGALITINIVEDGKPQPVGDAPDYVASYLRLDSSGTFYFSRLKPGAYVVYFRLIGYRMCTVRQRVAANSVDTIRMRVDTMSIILDGPTNDPRYQESAYCLMPR